MIMINIASKDATTVEKAAEILLKEKLIWDVNHKENVKRLNLVEGKIMESQLFILTAKTKALLFSKIESALKEHFSNNIPELYSLPITLMEWNQAEELKNNTQKI